MLDDFLDAIWPAGWRPSPALIEIRAIKGGVVEQHFYDLDRIGLTRAWQDVETHYTPGGWDTYFGVLPRLRRSGTNADVPETTMAIWGDVDAKKHQPDGRTIVAGKTAALAAINGFSTPPHIVVDSGGGYHCYWLLDEPVALPRAQEVMRWIAREVNGDFVQDGARVLRLPSTTNWKRTPTVARFIRFDTARPRIRLSDLEGQMPIPTEPHEYAVHIHQRVDEVPGWLSDLVVDGVPQGQRSEAAFRAMVWLIRYGRSKQEIYNIFAGNPEGIGQKMMEKSSYEGARWFDYSYTAAERVA